MLGKVIIGEVLGCKILLGLIDSLWFLYFSVFCRESTYLNLFSWFILFNRLFTFILFIFFRLFLLRKLICTQFRLAFLKFKIR